MKLTVNIVFTPGTVSLLGFMVFSLLRWSDCSFRLVANGCLPPESRFLQGLCKGHARLEFYPLPHRVPWPHGRVLNHLHALTREDLFGFMDSDIFATGEFLPPLLSSQDSRCAVFSGAPVWARSSDQVLPEGFRILSGPYNRTEKGVHLGCTYVAVYDSRMLAELTATAGVGFEERPWDDVPSPCRRPLADLGLAMGGYDTGKLLNALLITRGHQLRYVDSPHLTHLGGLSCMPPSAGRVSRWSWLPGAGFFRRLRAGQAFSARLYRTLPGISAAEVRAETTMRLDRRNVARSHFRLLLEALAAGRPLPDVPKVNDPEIRRKLDAGTLALVAAYHEFAGDRAGAYHFTELR